MMNNSDNDVFIIGGNHHNTLGVIRALGEQGLKNKKYLFIESQGDDFVSKSRYIKRDNVYLFNDEKILAQSVVNIAKKSNSRPIVICCGDHYINELDKSYNVLKNYCILPNADSKQGRISLYLNKERQRELAKKIGLNLPKSLYMMLDKGKLCDVSLPCIIKPVNSIEGGKSDIAICRTKENLESYIIEHPTKHEVIVEDFIEKSMEFQLIGCALSNEIIIPGYTSIIRQPENTNTGYLRYSPLQDKIIRANLLEKVKSFIREVGYKGLFSVEFIRDQEGDDYFLEINMRNDGNGYCVTCAGVNLPYIWYKYADSTSDIIERISIRKPIYWMPEADIKNAKTIGYIKWIQEWISAAGHGIFNIRDPYPIIYAIASRIKNKFSRNGKVSSPAR